MTQLRLKKPIKITVSNADQARAVETTLFRFGCGYANGLEFSKRPTDKSNLLGFAVSTEGHIDNFARYGEESRFEAAEGVEVKAEAVLASDSAGFAKIMQVQKPTPEERRQKQREIFLMKIGQRPRPDAEAGRTARSFRLECNDIYRMPPGPERRLQLIAVIARMGAKDGLAVNRRHQFNTEHDDDIKKLLKKGLLERNRIGGTYRKKTSTPRQTYLVLTEAGWEYARKRGVVKDVPEEPQAPAAAPA